MAIIDPSHRTPLADDLWKREIELQSLAMALARNEVGPKLPIRDVLAAEGVSESFADTALTDPIFQNLLKKYKVELTENGFSFQAKCRVIAEDVLSTHYAIIQDKDVPAAVRVKAIENVVKWGDLEPSTAMANKNTGPMFSIKISLPQPNASTIHVNAEALSPQQTAGIMLDFAQKAKEITSNLPEQPALIDVEFDDSDAYEPEE